MGLTNELAILGSIMIEPTLLSVVYSEGITPSTFICRKLAGISTG
jgi:hypothetical protein